MSDVRELSRFVPRFKRVETIDWYDHRAVRCEDSGEYYFPDRSGSVLLDALRSERLDVGELNERLYELTGAISPLRTVRFLLELSRRGFLENGDELEALVPEIPVEKHAAGRRLLLGSVRGLEGGVGILFPILFFAGIFALALLGGRPPGPPSLYPFPGRTVPSLLILPVTLLGLFSLRGFFAALVMLCLARSAALTLSFPLGLPSLSVRDRDITTASPVGRLLYYATVLFLYPAAALAAAALVPHVSPAAAEVLRLLFWECAVLFLFDLYLLHRSPAVGVIEELSGESSLDEKLRTFWRHGFATVESIFQNRFRKEELFYAMGIFQLAWFFAYLLLFLYVFRESAGGLYRLTLEEGYHVVIPAAAAALLGGAFFAATVLSFVARKAAVATVSLAVLGSFLVKGRTGGTESGHFPMDLENEALFASVPEGRKGEIVTAAKLMYAIPAFSDLPPETVLNLAKRSSMTIIEEGATIIEEGEISDGLFYIIGDGVVTVRRPGREAELGPEDHFGEIALLSDSPRTATVTAKTDVVAFTFRREDFVDLLMSDIGSLLELETKGHERLAGRDG